MNINKLILISALLFMPIFTLKAQINSFSNCENVGNPANFAFQNGESITLVANYKWGLVNTSVGEATMKLSRENADGTILYVADAQAKTYGFFDSFFKVRDHFISKFCTTTMRPHFFSQSTHEGKYTKKSTMVFDWKAMKIHVKKQRKKDPEYEIDAPLEKCMFDLISFVYYLRNINFDNLKDNDVIKIRFAFDEKADNLSVRFKGRCSVKTKSGTFNCFKLGVQTLVSETFPDGEEMLMYLSADRNHIPLYMELPLKIGHVRVSLSKYENLKFPVTSLVK